MSLRAFLELSRGSNLPTVWSNILAAWILGGGSRNDLVLLLIGATLLYTGGMFFNDFCDVKFDASNRPERPIPSGRISRRTVGIVAAIVFIVGLNFIDFAGLRAGVLALVLLGSILLYDFRHKGVVWAPWVMGFCRFLLYPLGASAGNPANLALVSFYGGCMALYVVGITYLARGESRPGKPSRWALIPLCLPLVAPLGLVICKKSPLESIAWTAFFSFALLAWMTWILIPFWLGKWRSVGRVVSGLLAGIVLVDAIAAASILHGATAAFILLFGLALLLQRTIPAT